MHRLAYLRRPLRSLPSFAATHLFRRALRPVFSAALASVVPSLLLLLAATTTARAQLLVSDFNLHRLVRIETSASAPFAATSASVFVSPGSGGLSLPHRSRLGPDGALYVASAGTDQLLRFNANTGAPLGVFAGPSGGALDYPVDFVFRPDGYVYVSSQLTNSVRRFSSSTGALDPLWSASHASLSGPSGLVFDSANRLYVAGRFSNNVVRFDAATGAHQLSFGNVSSAFGLALLPDGRLLAASGATGTVQTFAAPSSAAPAQSTFASGLNVPVGVEFDSVSSTVLVAHYGNGSLTRHAFADGALLGNLVAPGGALSGPNYFTLLDAAPIPEPATAALFTGLLALGARFFLRSRRHSA